MRKVYTIIVVLVLSMSYSKGQDKIAINEFWATNLQNSSKEFIELYSSNISDVNLENYYLITYKLVTVQGKDQHYLYVIDLPSYTIKPYEDRFCLISKNADISIGSPSTPADIVAGVSSSTNFSVKKYSFVPSPTNNQVTEITGFNSWTGDQILDPGGKNVIYLFKGNILQDIFIEKSPTSDFIINFPTTLSSFGQTFNLSSSLTLPNGYNWTQITAVATTGNNPVGRIFDGTCVTGATFIWDKTPGETPGAKNFKASEKRSVTNGQLDPSWVDNLYYPTTSTPISSASRYSFFTGNSIATKTSASYTAIIDSTVSPTQKEQYIRVSALITDTINTSPYTGFGVKIYDDFGSTTIGSFGADDREITQNIKIERWTGPLPTSDNGSLTGVIINITVKLSDVVIFTGNGALNNYYLIFSYGTNQCVNSIQRVLLGAALLPVDLTEFKIKNESIKNILRWTTATESNNKGFEVQRSIGSTNDFKTIGFVGTRAKDGNSQTELSYSFEDADVKAGQTHYYRLNQIDFDGKSAFSPVKSIKPGSIESNLNVYPNPSEGSFTVTTGSNSGKLNIFVMDNTGRVVNQFMNVSTSKTRINNLKKGFYTLKIVNTESGEQSAQRIVVQ